MSYVGALFILLCFTVLLHACNGAGVLLGTDETVPMQVTVVLDHQQPEAEAATYLKTISMLTAVHPIKSRKIITHRYDDQSSVSADKVKYHTEERIVQDQQNKEAQEYKLNESKNVVEDVEVVMDYAQPHRKPPIHNEEH